MKWNKQTETESKKKKMEKKSKLSYHGEKKRNPSKKVEQEFCTYAETSKKILRLSSFSIIITRFPSFLTIKNISNNN